MGARRLGGGLAATLLVAACSRAQPDGVTSSMPADDAGAAALVSTCDDGRTMSLRFYDVGQGLAALVELPDGRHLLVDAGDDPRRRGCGEACAVAHRHLVASLRRDLHGASIDLLWITHPHSDHIGGAADVLETFPVGAYVDDGRDLGKTEVRRTRRAAEDRGVPVTVVAPGQTRVPLASRGDVKLTAVVPPAWPAACAHDANECSIGLRIDDCRSSVLFVGDAEHEEERALDPGGPVTLLQVAHHGSETSTSPEFLSRTRPRYAVISAGKPGAALNRDYCHPRAGIVKRLSRVLGATTGTTTALEAFDGARCDRATPEDWVRVPASDALWATERDGDILLVTSGDGIFSRR
ncbi:MAG: ComEC/Rec2 family competence protein [Polyangiaceae bacterium]